MTQPRFGGRQVGMTYIGMLILLIFIAFFAMVMIKVVPLYLENYKIQAALDSLAEEGGSSLLTPAEIEDRLFKRLSINDIEHVTRKDVKVSRESGKTVVTVQYEARVNVFSNLDVVARFTDNRVELGGS